MKGLQGNNIFGIDSRPKRGIKQIQIKMSNRVLERRVQQQYGQIWKKILEYQEMATIYQH